MMQSFHSTFSLDRWRNWGPGRGSQTVGVKAKTGLVFIWAQGTFRCPTVIRLLWGIWTSLLGPVRFIFWCHSHWRHCCGERPALLPFVRGLKAFLSLCPSSPATVSLIFFPRFPLSSVPCPPPLQQTLLDGFTSSFLQGSQAFLVLRLQPWVVCT